MLFICLNCSTIFSSRRIFHFIEERNIVAIFSMHNTEYKHMIGEKKQTVWVLCKSLFIYITYYVILLMTSWKHGNNAYWLFNKIDEFKIIWPASLLVHALIHLSKGRGHQNPQCFKPFLSAFHVENKQFHSGHINTMLPGVMKGGCSSQFQNTFFFHFEDCFPQVLDHH